MVLRLALRTRSLVVVAVFAAAALACGGCASTLASLGIGYERGKANLVVKTSSKGIVFSERKPSRAAGIKNPDVVVMVHGLGGNKDHWTRFAAQMPDQLHLVALDLPGFGDSPKLETESYDLTSQAARLDEFLVERGIDKFHLLGSSMGGQLCAVYALAHPEKVTSLVLFDPAGITSPEKSDMEKAFGPRKVMPIRSAEDFDKFLEYSFVKPPDIPGFLKSYFAEQSQANQAFADKVRDDLDLRPRPLADEIVKLEPPTLVVWGQNDRILHPSAAPIWRARLLEHNVVILPQTGHGPMIERPSESAQLVLTWWRRRGIAPRAAP